MSKELGKPQSDSDVVNKEPKVLLIGYGWVGQQMGKYFTQAHYVGSNGIIKKQVSHSSECNDYECVCFDQEDDTVYSENRYDLAIISVPTPMNPKTGQCDVSIVEEVVKKYSRIVDIFLVKSTVEIGTCERLEKEYGVPVCMSPEFIGETLGHPMVEVNRQQFQIIGGNPIAREAVARMFMKVLHASAPIHLVTSKEAEIIKYCENMWIMQRVSYWNDVFAICQTMHSSFTAVREGIVLDPRMSRTHSNVYSDNRGWAGKCLPKDMNALYYTMKKNGLELTTLKQQIEKNAKVREKYDNHNKLIPDAGL